MKSNENVSKRPIPFNFPFIIGKELEYIEDAVRTGMISGNGKYTMRCQNFLQNFIHSKQVLLTTSCTHALEMAALLINIGPDDEVILPSFTFVSTANAFALRGAKLVFCDIREDTLNIDERLLPSKITKKTKVIVPVHYAGVACEMNEIMELARKNNIFVIEDAAQALGASYKNHFLGTIGDFGAFSFHETKNVICGEGGAISINNDKFSENAFITWEKGTNRRAFSMGQVEKYEWLSLGSSFLPSEILAAFLAAQLDNIETIMKRRKEIFNRYYDGLIDLVKQDLLSIPFFPPYSQISYHLFYIKLKNMETREKMLKFLLEKDITAVFHYLPLHLSPFGLKYTQKNDALPITTKTSATLLRLPFYYELAKKDQDYIIETIHRFFK